MSHITIPFLYLIAAIAYALHRLQPEHAHASLRGAIATVLAVATAAYHAVLLYGSIRHGDALHLSLASATSLIGLQLAVIAIVAGLDPPLRGVTAGLLVLAAAASTATPTTVPAYEYVTLTWQLQLHVLMSMFAYGLLTAGAIVAIYSLVQDRRLRAGKLTSMNRLFAPLETTEKLLFGVTLAGFALLLLSVVSGLTFIEDVFAQHLAHKTVLSLLTVVVFGVLLAGRFLAGWRGERAVYLYLGGFALLCLAYFGSRIVLEVVLNRSWS